MKNLEAKIVVLGSMGVGKTSIVVRYVTNSFSKKVSPTIGASFFTCRVIIDDSCVKLQVWDTAGQERFRSMAPLYYRKANAALLVYDITDLDSFEEVKGWISDLQKNVDSDIVLCLLGNKCDLEQDRKVSEDEALKYAASINASYFETSAETSNGINNVFNHVSQQLIQRPDSQSRSEKNERELLTNVDKCQSTRNSICCS